MGMIEKNKYSLLTINYVDDRHTEKLKITLYEKDYIVQQSQIHGLK